MHWIFLSPHLDDAVYSCGALIRDLSAGGERVSVWTICAADPPAGPLSTFAQSLHSRWQAGPAAVQQRRLEDQAACRLLGASWRHFDMPDCIYRRDPQDGTALYASESAIFGPVHPAEETRVRDLAAELEAETAPDQVWVCPLAIGGHVDHRFVRAAAQLLRTSADLHYYADFPYARDFIRQHSFAPDRVAQTAQQLGLSSHWQLQLRANSLAGLQAWIQAVGAYESQISTFWSDREAMRTDIQAYEKQLGGSVLWRPKMPDA